MDLGLSGRVAVVTGSSRGIGRACAESLLREGASVVISGRDKERLDKAAKEMEKIGGKVLAVQADLASDDAARHLVESAVRTFGKLDIVVNAAASVRPADFLSLTEALWPSVFEEKFNGYVRVLRHAIPIMQKQKFGRILNISGVAARQPHGTTVTVGLNNAAVLNLTKGLASWLAKDGITVNSVLPHIIDTDTQDDTMKRWAAMTGQTEQQVRDERIAKIPLKRMGRPEEVGDAVAFLVSDRATFITGSALNVEGGVTMSI
jgi:3-oxoacyl-[acyl-carrier protein] reductase